MEVIINVEPYEVKIIKKNNKNLYIRVKDDLCLHVTCNIFTTENDILNLIYRNEAAIVKMIEKQKRRIEKKQKFFFLGIPYKICLVNVVHKAKIIDDTIYARNLRSIDEFVKEQCSVIFQERLDFCFNRFNGRIPKPTLRIRKMKQKWGHCNKSECIVTLNSDLISYDIDEIDYVIIHELCHLIHFNHSKEFWYEVECYKPDFKKNRKVLREE